MKEILLLSVYFSILVPSLWSETESEKRAYAYKVKVDAKLKRYVEDFEKHKRKIEISRYSEEEKKQRLVIVERKIKAKMQRYRDKCNNYFRELGLTEQPYKGPIVFSEIVKEEQKVENSKSSGVSPPQKRPTAKPAPIYSGPTITPPETEIAIPEASTPVSSSSPINKASGLLFSFLLMGGVISGITLLVGLLVFFLKRRRISKGKKALGGLALAGCGCFTFFLFITLILAVTGYWTTGGTEQRISRGNHIISWKTRKPSAVPGAEAAEIGDLIFEKEIPAGKEDLEIACTEDFSVKIPKGLMDKPRELSFSKVKGEVKYLPEGAALVKAFDLSLGGMHNLPAPLSVKVKIPPIDENVRLQVAYWLPEKGDWQIVSHRMIDNETLEFETNHLSLWTIIKWPLAVIKTVVAPIPKYIYDKLAYDYVIVSSKEGHCTAFIDKKMKLKKEHCPVKENRELFWDAYSNNSRLEDYGKILCEIGEHCYKSYKDAGFSTPSHFSLVVRKGEKTPHFDTASWTYTIWLREPKTGESLETICFDLAHEIFHGIQNGYVYTATMDTWRWLMEGTAEYAAGKVAWNKGGTIAGQKVDAKKIVSMMGWDDKYKQGVDRDFIFNPLIWPAYNTNSEQHWYASSWFLDSMFRQTGKNLPDLWNDFDANGGSIYGPYKRLASSGGLRLGDVYHNFAAWLEFSTDSPAAKYNHPPPLVKTLPVKQERKFDRRYNVSPYKGLVKGFRPVFTQDDKKIGKTERRLRIGIPDLPPAAIAKIYKLKIDNAGMGIPVSGTPQAWGIIGSLDRKSLVISLKENEAAYVLVTNEDEKSIINPSLFVSQEEFIFEIVGQKSNTDPLYYRFTVVPKNIDSKHKFRYQWDFGDGERTRVSSRKQMDHKYSKDGTFQVIAKIYDNTSRNPIAIVKSKKFDIKIPKVAKRPPPPKKEEKPEPIPQPKPEPDNGNSIYTDQYFAEEKVIYEKYSKMKVALVKQLHQELDKHGECVKCGASYLYHERHKPLHSSRNFCGKCGDTLNFVDLKVPGTNMTFDEYDRRLGKQLTAELKALKERYKKNSR